MSLYKPCFAKLTLICELCLIGLTYHTAMASSSSDALAQDANQDTIWHTSRYQCEICEKSFASKQVRERHIQEIHGNPERNHKCPICEAMFVREENMITHKAAIHDKSLPLLKCQVCEKVFQRRGALNRHVREVHERKVKVAYDCPVSTCHDEFARKDNLERHITRGKHSTRASCRFCREEFRWKSHRGLVRILSGHYITEKSYQGDHMSGRCTAKDLRCINMNK